jgi:hypothetical protein
MCRACWYFAATFSAEAKDTRKLEKGRTQTELDHIEGKLFVNGKITNEICVVNKYQLSVLYNDRLT